MNNSKKISIKKIAILAICIVLNIVGSNLALMLRLPIYLDSIGTILGAALFGPVWGMLAGGITNLIMGLTTDLTSLYYTPVALVLGCLAGFLYRKISPDSFSKVWIVALLISLPGTILSTIITYFVFGGITSSGSSIIVQLLFGMGLSKFWAIFIVQVLTDFLDRLISVYIIAILYRSYKPLKKLKA
ncbi:ECF transporter S component [Ligilactobacillus cholophilus]|uniref:ECF transporter S component n=1 Tax=Ligilactobacillus cholophilus TaxID=3050131 RepID=UPI0025B14D78|nr:ECF transporter S component [Ligilactobacillus cholophilus]